MAAPKYKRILLKLSGEALAAGGEGILNFDFIDRVAEVLVRCREAGTEIGVIVGAGNIWRGRQGGEMDRTQADHMGMLATAINALALQDRFHAAGLDAIVMSAVDMPAFADEFTVRDAKRALEKGKTVIFACGLGQPFFLQQPLNKQHHIFHHFPQRAGDVGLDGAAGNDLSLSVYQSRGNVRSAQVDSDSVHTHHLTSKVNKF